MKKGFTPILSALAIPIILVVGMLVISRFFFKGYGGSPSGFLIEGNTLYVADSGFSYKPEGPVLPFLYPTTENAVWEIDLDKKRLKKVRRSDEEFRQKFMRIGIKGFEGSPIDDLRLEGKTYTIKNEIGNLGDEVEIKNQNGDTKIIKVVGKQFRNIISDNAGNIYFEVTQLVPGGTPKTFLFFFDKNTGELSKEIELKLLQIAYFHSTNSNIYLFGTGSVIQGGVFPYTVLKYDKSTNQLNEIHRVDSPHVSSAIHNELLFYGERGIITGTKRPRVTIYNFIEERTEAEIVGKGLGPNPITAHIRIGLTWATFPFMVVFSWIYSIFTYPFIR